MKTTPQTIREFIRNRAFQEERAETDYLKLYLLQQGITITSKLAAEIWAEWSHSRAAGWLLLDAGSREARQDEAARAVDHFFSR